MSIKSRRRAAALALLCCASSAAFAAERSVTVATQSLPMAMPAGKAPVKQAAEPMPAPMQFEIRGELDEHGHVKTQCHEVANPAFATLLRERAAERRTVEEQPK